MSSMSYLSDIYIDLKSSTAIFLNFNFQTFRCLILTAARTCVTSSQLCGQYNMHDIIVSILSLVIAFNTVPVS